MSATVERTKSGAAASSKFTIPEAERQQVQEDYFSELLGYSVDRLSKEPELLRADQDQLRRQIQDTAVNHYRAFIGAANCIEGLQTELSDASNHLDALIKDLPKLQEATEAFRRDATEINNKRVAIRQLYSKYLIPLPSFIHAYIKTKKSQDAVSMY